MYKIKEKALLYFQTVLKIYEISLWSWKDALVQICTGAGQGGGEFMNIGAIWSSLLVEHGTHSTCTRAPLARRPVPVLLSGSPWAESILLTTQWLSGSGRQSRKIGVMFRRRAFTQLYSDALAVALLSPAAALLTEVLIGNPSWCVSLIYVMHIANKHILLGRTTTKGSLVISCA